MRTESISRSVISASWRCSRRAWAIRSQRVTSAVARSDGSEHGVTRINHWRNGPFVSSKTAAPDGARPSRPARHLRDPSASKFRPRPIGAKQRRTGVDPRSTATQNAATERPSAGCQGLRTDRRVGVRRGSWSWPGLVVTGCYAAESCS